MPTLGMLASPKMMHLRTYLLFATLLMSGLLHADEAAVQHSRSQTFPHESVQYLWPAGTENVRADIAETATIRDFERVSNIHNPNLTVFRPDKPNGSSIVICPGGAYRIIATGKEGDPVAERLNEAGITAFVLKYRLPNTKGAHFKHPIPLSDALRAIQWVRYHAEAFDLDPNKIGIMGASAGGHLAATAGTLYDRYSFGDDAISKVSSRPDFMCLIYPVISTQKGVAHGCIYSLLDPKQEKKQRTEISVDQNVTEHTPPTFLIHAKDDKAVVPENSLRMLHALEAKGIEAELKLYDAGGHGFGLGREGTDSTQWPDDFLFWLERQSVIPAEKTFYTPESDLKALTDDKKLQGSLPNVLLIGDSISIGYTPFVFESLKDEANVRRHKGNAGDTNRGLKNIDQWLGTTQWDVIHFNWGLHDLCYRHPEAKVYGQRDKINGTQSVPLEQYQVNLEKLVTRLKAKGAKLIWATTTVVPEGEAGRFVGDEIKYNQVAEKIMQKHEVAINDLHAASSQLSEHFVRTGDVHFTKEGSAALGAQVAEAIREVLSAN